MIYTLGIGLVVSIIVSLLISPMVLSLMRKIKANQPILSYVDNHSSKSGTPTMGGLIFITAGLLVSLSILPSIGSPMIVMLLAVVAYSLIGVVDDSTKIREKKNAGLTPNQKLIGQILISLLISIYCYNSEYIGSSIVIPAMGSIDIGWYIIPLDTIALVAIVNCVNLTDGLDGLVTDTGSIALFAFSILAVITAEIYGKQSLRYIEVYRIAYCGIAFSGALFAFIVVNSFPAKIFMGDTGSLGIGGIIGCVAVFTGNVLYLPIIGIVYLISGLSVILQVVWYKLTKKRIFLMAPFHHHLERKGIHENKIVALYTVTTVLVSAFAIIFFVR